MVSVDYWYLVIALVVETVLAVQVVDVECHGAAMTLLAYQRVRRAAAVRIPLRLPEAREASNQGHGPQAAGVSCVKARTLSRCQGLEEDAKSVYHTPKNAAKESFATPMTIGYQNHLPQRADRKGLLTNS